jgi:PAS domain S-box-containing protein
VKESIRILFLEDVPTDTELAERELRQEKISFLSQRVENEKDFRAALEQYKPDLIISDFALPTYDGMRALRLVREELHRTTPFILFTGSMNEETAVTCMKAGATDYVIKEHMKRLPFAVKEALRKAEALKAKEKAESVLRESEERLRLALIAARQGLYDLNVQTGETFVSDEYALMLGYEPAEFIETNEGRLERMHPEDREQVYRVYEEYIAEKRDEYRVEFRQRTKTGDWTWILSLGKIVEWDREGQPLRMLGTHTDINERKSAEQMLKASLEEKNALLKELYHRTKNNMQVIAGLISLQASYTRDERIIKISKTTENRILVMALVHEKLYESRDLSCINLQEYIHDLVSLISSNSHVKPEKVIFDMQVEPIEIIIDAAIPFGLVLHELISNSLQHAFPGERRGEVKIRCGRKDADKIEIIVSDNGIGVQEGFDFRKSETLGAQLIIR